MGSSLRVGGLGTVVAPAISTLIFLNRRINFITMKVVARELIARLREAARQFPSVILTGPRRVGKSTLLRHAFPDATYVLMEDPSVVARLRADPVGFLDGLALPAILDEVQQVPEIFAHVRARIDADPRRCGRWFLTGSQEAPLMQGVAESMAGRAAILQLRPLSVRESPKVDLLRGGYPEVITRPAAADLWFSSYVQTYLERDVRAVTAVRDLATFRRFLALVASRHGQILNRTDLAAPLGVSIPTINDWLGILEITAQILLVPSWFENLGKRLIKSPKIYVADSGLACHLLGITSAAELERSPFLGALFEGFIAAELIKQQVHRGARPELYYFRDAQGLEVDFLRPSTGGGVELLECKAGKTPQPSMAAPMQRLAIALRAARPAGAPITMTLLHRGRRGDDGTTALAPGVQALPWREWLLQWVVKDP
jgi:hypothetical protein